MGGDAGIHYAVRGSGTFGLVREAGGEFEVITNNHVGANEDVEGHEYAREGDLWIQPGAQGGGTVTDAVATLHRWNKIVPVTSPSYRTNLYDVAIARVLEEAKAQVRAGEIRNIGAVQGWDLVELGDAVVKMGARTDRTAGIVRAVFPIGFVASVGPYQGHMADFAMQVVMVSDNGPFSDHGDSGSVIVNEQVDPESGKRKAKALLFAGGTDADGIDYTIASPIGPIVSNFSFRI